MHRRNKAYFLFFSTIFLQSRFSQYHFYKKITENKFLKQHIIYGKPAFSELQQRLFKYKLIFKTNIYKKRNKL